MSRELLIFVVVLFVLFGGAVLQPLIEAEVLGSWPMLTRALLRVAARQLPADARGDVLAEWAAELDTLRDRPLSALSLALGLVATTWLAAQELPASRRRSAQTPSVADGERHSSQLEFDATSARPLVEAAQADAVQADRVASERPAVFTAGPIAGPVVEVAAMLLDGGTYTASEYAEAAGWEAP